MQLLANFTYYFALSYDLFHLCIIQAITKVDDLDTPAQQCTKTPPSLLLSQIILLISSNNSHGTFCDLLSWTSQKQCLEFYGNFSFNGIAYCPMDITVRMLYYLWIFLSIAELQSPNTNGPSYSLDFIMQFPDWYFAVLLEGFIQLTVYEGFLSLFIILFQKKVLFYFLNSIFISASCFLCFIKIVKQVPVIIKLIRQMQYKKKGIQKPLKKKNNSNNHGKKKAQNKDKFSKNEPAAQNQAKTQQQRKAVHKNDEITKTINKNIQKTLMERAMIAKQRFSFLKPGEV